MFREYKEALRQQRNQDSSSIYRPKDNSSSDDSPSSFKSPTPSTPSPTIYATTTNQSPLHQKSSDSKTNPQNGHSPSKSPTNNGAPTTPNKNGSQSDSPTLNNKKPIQKVTPSRTNNVNATYQNPTQWTINGNHKTVEITTTVTKEYNVYVKPTSPTKAGAGTLGYNNVPALANQNGNGTKASKPNRLV